MDDGHRGGYVPRGMNGAATIEERLAEELAYHGMEGFELAVVLGSGLGEFAELLENRRDLPFQDLTAMPTSRVPGHAGRFVLGELAGVRLIVQQGRVHLYEGWSSAEVTASVRACARLGARTLLLTNASGGLVKDWNPPCLMRIEDHLDLQGRPPLRPGEEGRGTPYDPEAGRVLDEAAREAGVELLRGTYAGVLGPAYETPAEIQMLADLSVHAVGMSTVAEASVGHAAGLRVAALSAITNPAAGLRPGPLEHDQVVAAGEALSADLCALLAAAVPRLAALS